jgi:hypothetical protein
MHCYVLFYLKFFPLRRCCVFFTNNPAHERAARAMHSEIQALEVNSFFGY